MQKSRMKDKVLLVLLHGVILLLTWHYGGKLYSKINNEYNGNVVRVFVYMFWECWKTTGRKI